MDMPTFVINLDRRQDRMEHIQSQLDKIDLDFIRIPAVDGHTLDKNIASEQAPDISDCEYACYSSHRKCWEALVQSDYQRCLILEDDVIVSQNLKSILNNDDFFIGHTGIVRLETHRRKVWVKREADYTLDGISLRKLCSGSLGTGAYVISRKHAEKLLESITRPTMAIDHILFNPKSSFFEHGNTSQIDPAPCVQGKRDEINSKNEVFSSDIGLNRTGISKQRLSRYGRIKREVSRSTRLPGSLATMAYRYFVLGQRRTIIDFSASI
ncbi:glycosyltransferase family 25 protein [Solemya elarraichensis gill symbiont]|uniref:Glycosyl transferase family 25 domain-containing protein n=1 Tax=Solemya elarraichensis gill symbiont TaxID=1918949 RepID=A0A1T2LCB8_9GAMM|nr:glycosyltransferase family 25 protein [Solemya elarraichensis gill symbiont]OOZ42730.1 hypothetical protein BOW52_01850 [Solemya elarraichensis gill symbiont]